MAHAETERELEGHLPGELEVEGEELGQTRPWAHFKQLARDSLLLKTALVLVAIAIFLTIFGPVIAPQDLEASTANVNEPPSGENWFGTDGSGFDVFSRVIAAPRIDVSVALIATAVSMIVGGLLGLATSFFRGWAGELTMRTTDVVQAFPLFVLAVVIVISAGRSLTNIVIVIALLNAPIFLRLVRSEVLSLRERTFVEAARANGDTSVSIALRHVLPNALAPSLAQASITLGYSIIVIAGLSFVGAGVQPPTPEWGAMIAAGRNDIIVGQWWTSVFPGIAMSLTVFGFAVVGEAIQTVLLRRR